MNPFELALLKWLKDFSEAQPGELAFTITQYSELVNVWIKRTRHEGDYTLMEPQSATE